MLPTLDSDMQPAHGACLLEEAKDECVEPHGVVGELHVLADLAIKAVQQLGRGAYGKKQNVDLWSAKPKWHHGKEHQGKDRRWLGAHACACNAFPPNSKTSSLHPNS